jgi:hypothetical protein
MPRLTWPAPTDQTAPLRSTTDMPARPAPFQHRQLMPPQAQSTPTIPAASTPSWSDHPRRTAPMPTIHVPSTRTIP